MPEVPDLLWLAGIGLLAVLLLAVIAVGRRQEQAERPIEAPAFCAWCAWQSGDDCTAPNSPISGGACGSVCSGEMKCLARQQVPQ